MYQESHKISQVLSRTNIGCIWHKICH
ncbi:hypothetical protein LINGRAHAP2_LOCUS22347 [Linum grandiflorum]